MTDLAYNGLGSYLKEKLEGFDFLLINHLQMKAVGLEFKHKNAKDAYKTHQSNSHVVDHDSNSSDGEEKEVLATEFVRPSKAIQKNRQSEVKFTFDVSK